MTELIIGSNCNKYIYDSLYESYIESKIDAETALARAFRDNGILTESTYSNIVAINEAKLGDKIKARWLKFVSFIKGLAAKFMESMSNILLDEKEYLEKYKDIILKRRPKDDMEYSYNGDYEKGIKRMINTEVPLFDYKKFQKELDSEEDGPLVSAIMSGKEGFKYNDALSLNEQFKEYFLALDAGNQSGKFSDLNMTNLYNFCYNFKQCKNIVDKDINTLEKSTNNLVNAIKTQLRDQPKTPPESDRSENPSQSDGSGAESENNKSAEGQNSEQSTNESTLFFTEADDNNSQNKTDDNKSKNSNLNITGSTSAASKMGSTSQGSDEDRNNSANNSAEALKGNEDAESAIQKAAAKWINVCRPIIAAKLTAYQSIAGDYMKIIRAHVRSYGGTDLKKDKTSQQSAKAGDIYRKDSEHDAKEAEKLDDEAIRAQNNRQGQ